MDPPRGHDAGERVQASFARQGLMRLLGAEVVEVGEGTCVIEVPFTDGITQQESYFHGAVTAAIADTAGGYAAMTLAPPDREVLTVEYKVNFLAPAKGEKLVARGEVVTAGRRLFVCRAEVSAVEGRDERVCAATLQTLLTVAGDNPQRLRSEASFASLCGVSPVEASSGKVVRHRLNRGGNQEANRALYMVCLARMRRDPRTREYVARRSAEGKSKREIIRCLKRYVARETYRVLVSCVACSSLTRP